MRRGIAPALAAALLGAAALAFAGPDEAVLAQARAQKEPLLRTLEELVGIESGSRDAEGLRRIAEVVAAKLREAGGEVEVIQAEEAPRRRARDDPPPPAPMVRATFAGRGERRILLLAHMDTVYPRGSLSREPFRVAGNRAYGLGISDDKQGVAVIVHALAMLRALRFDGHGTLTVLVNGDEEIGSPASRALITELGASHDAVLSFEPTGDRNDRLSLTTSGTASLLLRVTGRASHAGASPHTGVNALYEMAHQVLQMRDLSDAEAGTRLNWTTARAGTMRNVIPEQALATADVRVRRESDLEALEARIAERVKNRLLPGTTVEYTLRRGRPALLATDASRALARHSQAIYAEVGGRLEVEETALGGGTDAAYASLRAKGPVVERYGLRGAGAHTGGAEYIVLDSIEPRLYLVARTLMDLATGKVPLP